MNCVGTVQADGQHEKWNRGSGGRKKKTGVHKFTVCEKGGCFGWNDKGVELYKTLRGCF